MAHYSRCSQSIFAYRGPSTSKCLGIRSDSSQAFVDLSLIDPLLALFPALMRCVEGLKLLIVVSSRFVACERSIILPI